MKVGDLVKNLKTLDVGIIMEIRNPSAARVAKLYLARCYSGTRFFETRIRNLVLLNES